MSSPNIFAYAPSELSQDAVLAWLLAWGDPSNAQVDPVLHATGRRFIEALFATHDSVAPNAEIDIRLQELHTDVLALVGDTALIAIEDKVGSGPHSDQLIRYRDVLAKKYPNRCRILVYLKTIEQASYAEVDSARWKIFNRGDLLDVLRPAKTATNNAILLDFVDHLQGIDAATQAFATAPFDEWSDAAYRGFFVRLNEEFSGYWDYVANPTGGFMGYWWNFRTVERGQLYLQLESERLVVKLGVEDETDRGAARSHWLDRVLEGMASEGFKRPKRLGRGATMTLAISAGDYRVQRDGQLDLAATVERLRDAAKALDELTS